MKTKINRPNGNRSAQHNRCRLPKAAQSPGTRPAADGKLGLKSILVPVDFSPGSKKALKYALPFAEQFGAQIILLHVIEPVATPDFAYFPLMMENDKVIAAARAQLDMLCKQEAIEPRLVARTLARNGKPFHEITEAARTLKVDLIIIATHGYTGLKRAFLGSTAERVVRHAPCPVLVVREREHEFVAG